MEIGSAPSMPMTAQNVGGSEDREIALKNALNNIQARYGEKPKEVRPIKKTLDKDDFMRIMITEMKHQDPTKPMDAEKLSGQMAQLTSVEQLKSVNNSVDKLVEKNNASDRLAMSAMIGKTVTVDKSRFVHQKGFLSQIAYDLPENTSKVTMKVLDEAGEEVFTRELEPQKAGKQTYNWDGLSSNGVYAKSSSYSVKIEAENEKGAKVKVDPISKETIVGVSFDGGETNFIVGSGKSNQKVAMRNVIRIEGLAGQMPAPSVVAPSSEATQNSAQPNSVQANAAFEPPAELKEKIAEQLKVSNEESSSGSEWVKAEGFPHGLSE
jgi:flagellar basal-body rod modification protein FlgD